MTEGTKVSLATGASWTTDPTPARTYFHLTFLIYYLFIFIENYELKIIKILFFGNKISRRNIYVCVIFRCDGITQPTSAIWRKQGIREIKICKKCPKVNPYCDAISDSILIKPFFGWCKMTQILCQIFFFVKKVKYWMYFFQLSVNNHEGLVG